MIAPPLVKFGIGQEDDLGDLLHQASQSFLAWKLGQLAVLSWGYFSIRVELYQNISLGKLDILKGTSPPYEGLNLVEVRLHPEPNAAGSTAPRIGINIALSWMSSWIFPIKAFQL